MKFATTNVPMDSQDSVRVYRADRDLAGIDFATREGFRVGISMPQQKLRQLIRDAQEIDELLSDGEEIP
ncbi:MAG: hypothetical protein ACREN8_07985, partial [Candidatus Dormibacteraceae bacterium]